MPAIRESETTYEGAGGSNLPMLISEPAEDVKAGIVMFHGGALHGGSPDDLPPHCRRLAARGIFAVSSGYRLIDQGATSIGDCIADVRRAVERAASLAQARGLDPWRLASGGSSAGAHLALVAAMIAPRESPHADPARDA